MAYRLQAVTIRTDNSLKGMERITALWQDIISGNLPVLFDSDHVMQNGILPVARYSNYSGDETGEYDLSVMTVTEEFFAEMEEKVRKGLYKKAWETVWSEQKTGSLQRCFTKRL